MQSPPPNIWTFTVIAAFVTTAGTLFGHYLKEMILARSLETWKQHRTLAEIHRKYRDPIVLSAIDLAKRLSEICKEYPTDYLKQTFLTNPPPAPSHSTARDAYFCRYKFLSTVYRLSAFLGWVELYRQELVFMDTESSKTTGLLEPKLEAIRQDIADGHLNDANDWLKWEDALLFREEQRAIGEAMIGGTPAGKAVIGYGAFLVGAETSQHPIHRWVPIVANFFADPKDQGDFRRKRYERLLVHLVDLVDAIDSRRKPNWLAGAADKYQASARVVDRRSAE